jgi:hypothetical protein
MPGTEETPPNDTRTPSYTQTATPRCAAQGADGMVVATIQTKPVGPLEPAMHHKTSGKYEPETNLSSEPGNGPLPRSPRMPSPRPCVMARHGSFPNQGRCRERPIITNKMAQPGRDDNYCNVSQILRDRMSFLSVKIGFGVHAMMMHAMMIMMMMIMMMMLITHVMIMTMTLVVLGCFTFASRTLHPFAAERRGEQRRSAGNPNQAPLKRNGNHRPYGGPAKPANARNDVECRRSCHSLASKQSAVYHHTYIKYCAVLETVGFHEIRLLRRQTATFASQSECGRSLDGAEITARLCAGHQLPQATGYRGVAVLLLGLVFLRLDFRL